MFNPTDAKQDRVIKGRTGFLGQHAMDEGLPPEIEQGNVEYKLKLVNISPDRLEHLITQMKWRISEGGGEALYEIGIADDGQLVGLSEQDLNESFATLTKMAAKLSADCSIVRKRAVTPSPSGLSDSGTVRSSPSVSPTPNDHHRTGHPATTDASGTRMVAEVLVRKRVEEEHFLEIKVAIVGGSDSGKSTLLGVLTHSEPDNGFGKARSRAFNHKHELETGRTSSLAHELIGFDSEGKLVNFANPSVVTSHHIVERSSKIIALSDIPGHRQFMHTAVAGISALHPHYALVMVNANQPVEVTKEHLGLLLVLRIPFLIVVSKIDVTPPESIKNTLQALLAVIKGPGARLVPCMMKNEDDMVATMPHFGSGGVVPIFLLSSVTGANVNLLVKFLNLLQVPPATNADDLAHKDIRFQIREIYDVPSVGTILGGQLLSGTLVCSNTRHPTVLLGPFEGGEYRKVQVHSIHRFCRPVRYVKPGQAATLAIKYVEPAPHVLPHHLMVEGVAAPLAGMPVTASASRRRVTMVTAASAATTGAGGGGIPIPGARRTSPPAAAAGSVATTLLSVSPPERSSASAGSSPLPLRPRKVPAAARAPTPNAHSSTAALASASPPPSPYRQSHAHKDHHHHARDPSSPVDPLTVLPADLRRGMVLVSTPSDATAAWTFDVQLHMLYHASELTPGQTAVVYCGSVRQAARVVWVERDLRVRTGDMARVRFQFLNVPEWMQLGATMLAREGRAGKMKCMGRILAVGAGGEEEGGVEDPVGRAMRKRAGSAPPGVMVGRSLSPPKAGGNR